MEYSLAASNVKKIYSNGVEALKGLDLNIRSGDFFALLGPNGAGKSTLIGIVSGLVNKSAGKVEIFGIDIDKDFPRARTFIGLVPQEFNFSIFETPLQILLWQAGYYGIPKSQALHRAEELLRQLDLWDKRKEQSRTLSGGMKRRLMIARSLIHRPKLLILDEPTAGVDIEIRRSMWNFLSEINRDGTTIVLTTHYLEEAESLCKNIAIISKGQVVENTSIKELLSRTQQETLILDVPSFERLPPSALSGFQYRKIDGSTIEVSFDSRHNVSQMFAELSQYGVTVKSLRNKTNRLEELFVGLVSKEKST